MLRYSRDGRAVRAAVLLWTAPVIACAASVSERVTSEAVQVGFTEAFERIDQLTIRGTEEHSLVSAFDVNITDNHVYVTAPRSKRVYAFDRRGQFEARIGGVGAGPGEFSTPLMSVADNAGNLYVNDFDHRKVIIFDPDHNFRDDFLFRGQGQLLLLAADDETNGASLAMVGRVGDSVIQLYSATGEKGPLFAGAGTDWPHRAWAAAVAPDGDIYVINHIQSLLYQFRGDGELERVLELSSPTLHPFEGADLDTPRERTRADVMELVAALRRDKHTRIERLVILVDTILVGIRRYQFGAERSADALDVYDRGGNLLYYGIDTPGRLYAPPDSESIFFVDIDDHGENYGVVTLGEYRFRLAEDSR